jgi:hypothetical protein
MKHFFLKTWPTPSPEKMNKQKVIPTFQESDIYLPCVRKNCEILKNTFSMGFLTVGMI